LGAYLTSVLAAAGPVGYELPLEEPPPKDMDPTLVIPEAITLNKKNFAFYFMEIFSL
jgi:hypothetical protein